MQLSGAVNEQYESADDNGFSDFAHFQISLAARLAYYLGKDNLFSNIYTKGSDEKVSYLAGWLGDATLKPVVFKNDDYQADLSTKNTRADEFVLHISYEYAKEQILKELDCNMDTLKTSYPDSYVF